MAEFFEVGDKVILNSGGPIMTIITLISDQPGPDVLVCVWTHSNGVSARERFDRRTVSLLVQEDL